jgi:hypothetical protein
MTTILVKHPYQADRLVKELTRKGFEVSPMGCLIETNAGQHAVTEAAFYSGVQAESMAGLAEVL